MKHSIIEHKTILGIDSNMDILNSLEKNIFSVCPECRFDKAANTYHGVQYLSMFTYDLVISDIMSSPGVDLANMIASHNFPVLVLSKNGTSLEELKGSNGMRVCAVLNKHNVKGFIPTVEKVLKLECMPAWKHSLLKLGRFFRSLVSWLTPKNFDPDSNTCVIFY